MFDQSLDRTLSYRLASAYDCWGRRRTLRSGIQHGTWFLDARDIDEPASEDVPVDTGPAREDWLAVFKLSERFSAIELATLDALIVERLTISEIAQRDGCSRQAVVARIVGNSKRQGGILKKSREVRRHQDLLLLRRRPQ